MLIRSFDFLTLNDLGDIRFCLNRGIPSASCIVRIFEHLILKNSITPMQPSESLVGTGLDLFS